MDGIGPALAIQGHHLGLQQLSQQSLEDLRPEKPAHSHPQSLHLAEQDIGVLMGRLRADGIEASQASRQPAYSQNLHAQRAALMLDICMLKRIRPRTGWIWWPSIGRLREYRGLFVHESIYLRIAPAYVGISVDDLRDQMRADLLSLLMPPPHYAGELMTRWKQVVGRLGLPLRYPSEEAMKLDVRDQAVVALVTQGLTPPEIGQRLLDGSLHPVRECDRGPGYDEDRQTPDRGTASQQPLAETVRPRTPPLKPDRRR